GGLTKRWHDLAREELHGAQDARVLQIAEPEAAVEVRDADHLLDALDLPDAGLRRADDQVALKQVVDGRLLGTGPGNGAPPLPLLVVVTQAQRHAHVPARLLGRRPRVRLAVRYVDGALDPYLQRTRRLGLRDQTIEEAAELAHPLEGDPEAAREHV